MGIDICYFLDHDLPTDNPQVLYEELKKRIPDNEIILHNCEKVPFSTIPLQKNVWYVLYQDTYPDIVLHYEDDIFTYHPSLYKKVADVGDVDKDGKTAFDYLRWNYMKSYFRDNMAEGHQWVSSMINNLNFLVKVFHSTKLLLTADSSSYQHEMLCDDYLREQGKTIDEALEMNQLFNPPCKVWRNNEAFGRAESDYEGDKNNCAGPFFIFDVGSSIIDYV